MTRLRDNQALLGELTELVHARDYRATISSRSEHVAAILDAVDRHLVQGGPASGVAAVKPGRFPCKPWCGTKASDPAWHDRFYFRKGVYYCRDRCAREAARFERCGPRVESLAPNLPPGPLFPGPFPDDPRIVCGGCDGTGKSFYRDSDTLTTCPTCGGTGRTPPSGTAPGAREEP